MNLKKDLKKLEKLYSAKKKKVARATKRYVKKQKITRGDLVFLSTMAVIFLLTIVMSARFAVEVQKLSKQPTENLKYGVNSNRVRHQSLRSIVLGARDFKKGNLVNGPESLKVPILMYHRIDPGTKDQITNNLLVPAMNFEEQLSYLRSEGYTTLGFDDMYRAFYAGEALPEKSVILTFDDGYVDNYQYAFPLLKKYNQKATFFVSTSYTDVNNRYMTKSQIKEMSEAGMDIESHIVNHADMAIMPPEVLSKELTDSKRTLEKWTNRDIFFIAYPYGSYNQQVVNEAQKAGYLMGISTRIGKNQKRNDPFGLFRFSVGPRTTISSFSNIVR
jgi:peptidoglycan/xylan/chitin deacetylase (PgdA/CDA1 family)